MIINMGIIIVNTSETQSSLLTTVALLQAVLELLSHMIFINSFFFQLVFEFILILKLMACNMSQKSWDWELPKARKVNVL